MRAAVSFDWKPCAIVTKAADRSALAHSENYRIYDVDISSHAAEQIRTRTRTH